MSAANLDVFYASLAGIVLDYETLQRRTVAVRNACRDPWPALDEVLRRLDDLAETLEDAKETAP